MALSEQQLITWSSPVSTSEDQKCKNVITQITEALRVKFGNSVSIFLQGSYRNNTNIKQDSDVDVVVRRNDYYFPNVVWLTEEQRTTYHSNNPNSEYTFSQYKSEVQNALQQYFGNIERKNKCIFIPGNTYRVNADVVPCFVLKRYTNPNTVDAEGIKLIADSGEHIESYPEQHYTNGVSKNNNTSRMYKRTVRILKRIRNELIDSRVITEELVSSFFIECLVYNVPNDSFVAGNYRQTLRSVIVKVYNDMLDPAITNEYEEVSGLKWLFKGGGKPPGNAKIFMNKCWNYAGFE